MIDSRKATPNSGGSARRDSRDETPGKRFAYEMAFQARFQGRRWDEVERELREAYPGWLKAHGLAGERGAEWDDVKRQVREAWDSAPDVQHAESDPWTGQWDERASEYRSFWEGRYAGAPGRRWEDDEVGYRYADSMALDPRFVGRPWADVAPGMQAGFPTWTASHGYRITEGESAWERLRDVIRDAWEHMKHRRST
ncbi:MAG TPA: hypothetical protein VKW09_12030 [bacterium]|nr:hypothetical protein [bacterium]